MPKRNRRRRSNLRKLAAGLGLVTAVILTAFLVWPRGGSGESARAPKPEPPPPVSFTHEVRPLLAAQCWSCHAAGGEAAPALDGEDAGALLSALTGPVIPDDEAHRELLTLQERSLVTRWLSEGAKHEPHWAFQPLPEIVTVPPGPGQPIDRLLAGARPGAHGKKPGRADSLTLLRRVTLDLAGRPPTVAEAEALLAAEDPVRAYRQAVERLLEDPSFAENFTAWWMQTTRYADSGTPPDGSLFAPWRNWVLRSFRENRPFDDFIARQLAGDLPGGGSPEATAIFLSPLHGEAGIATPGEAVERFGLGFLGLPLTGPDLKTEDHAHLQALFQTSPDLLPALSSLPAGIPSALLANAEQRKAIAALDKDVETLLSELWSLPDEDAFTAWLTQERRAPLVPGLSALIDGETSGPEIPNRALGQTASASAPDAALVAGAHGKALLLGDGATLSINGVPAPSLVAPWTIAFWFRLPGEGNSPADLLSAGNAGAGLNLVQHGNLLTLCWWTGGQARSLALQTALPDEHTREWNHLAVISQGGGDTGGLTVLLNGREAPLTTVRRTLQELPFPDEGEAATLRFGPGHPAAPAVALDEINVFGRALSPLEGRQLWDQQSLSVALANPKDHIEQLRGYFLANLDRTAADLRLGISAALRERAKLVAGLLSTPVLRNRPSSPTAILADYFPPEAVPTLESRADLAKWMLEPAHPLTARVIVNRIWDHFHGEPLVAPVDDLSLSSGPHPHPDLLDWLARDFVASGWNFQQLCRTIVNSAHYRHTRETPHPLPVHVRQDLPFFLGDSRGRTRWIYQWHPASPSAIGEMTPGPFGDETERVRIARTLSHDLLRNVPGSDEERLRHLLLMLRCQDDSHPDFKILQGYLGMRREAAAKKEAEAPVVILGTGIESAARVDPLEWALWLDLCSSLLEDPNLLRQR